MSEYLYIYVPFNFIYFFSVCADFDLVLLVNAVTAALTQFPYILS